MISLAILSSPDQYAFTLNSPCGKTRTRSSWLENSVVRSDTEVFPPHFALIGKRPVGDFFFFLLPDSDDVRGQILF